MSALFDPVRAVEVPKVLLHDHLDGGLRPTTILELADEIGWTPRLPSTDPGTLHQWFISGAETKDLLQYLATFEHTMAVMQRADDLVRVARECAIDLANDGVVYAEVRFAPELHVHRGLSLEAVVEAVQSGFRDGCASAAGCKPAKRCWCMAAVAALAPQPFNWPKPWAAELLLRRATRPSARLAAN